MPWHEGAAFAAALRACGAPARLLIYNHISHQQYVMAWKLRPAELLPCSQDTCDEQQRRLGGDMEFQQDMLAVLRSMQPRRQGPAAAARLGVVHLARM